MTCDERIGYRLTMEQSPAVRTWKLRFEAMVCAAVELHSCKPTRSAPLVLMASMHLLRLKPPLTQMLKLITFSCVTGAACSEQPAARMRKASARVRELVMVLMD